MPRIRSVLWIGDAPGFEAREVGASPHLDLAWVRKLPIEQMREYHDYAFDMARRNRDVIFGHWLMFEPQRHEESLEEFRRARDADAGFVGFAVSGQSTGVPASDPLWDPFYELAIET